MGCILYEMCMLRPPFFAPNAEQVFEKIKIGTYPDIPIQYSIELDDMIRKCL